MNLEDIAKRKKDSKQGRRFYTPIDMAIIKKDIARINSQVKRGEVDHSSSYIAVCGCGREGCFIHGYSKPILPQERYNHLIKYWRNQK